LRYGVTGCKPFQGSLGMKINNEIESLARSVNIFEMTFSIVGLSLCIALCHRVLSVSYTVTLNRHVTA